MIEGVSLSTLLQLLQLGAMVIGGAMVLSALRANVSELARRMVSVEAEVKKVVDVLVALAKTDARIEAVERHQVEQAERLRALEHVTRP